LNASMPHWRDGNEALCSSKRRQTAPMPKVSRCPRVLRTCPLVAHVLLRTMRCSLVERMGRMTIIIQCILWAAVLWGTVAIALGWGKGGEQ